MYITPLHRLCVLSFDIFILTSNPLKEGLVVQFGQAGQNRVSKWLAQGYPGKHTRRA